MENEIVKQNNQVQHFNFFDAEQFQTMQRICAVFANSELVPEMYRITEKNTKDKAIANCMIAIETANRIGASPLMVMQNMYIVHGQPAWSAKFLTATVNSCGRYNSIKYRFDKLGSTKGINYTEYEWKNENGKNKRVPVTKTFNEDIENWQCVAYTTEKGSEKGSDEVLESIPVTIDMAIKEGWYTKDGSKWKTMPKLMLQYRAVTFWTRVYAPELSMGMRTEDELSDYIPYEDVSAKVQEEIKSNANKEAIGFEPKVNDNGANGSANTSAEKKSSKEKEQKESPEPAKSSAQPAEDKKQTASKEKTTTAQTLGPDF